MFSRWKFARIKVAENALDEGRLDDAFDRVRDLDLKNDNRAQDLLSRLAAALLARSRVLAQAGRYVAALADLDRVAVLNRMTPEAQELRRRFEQEHNARAERIVRHDDAYQDAAREIRAGNLESGQLALERVEDSRRRRQLREELDARVQRNEQLLEQAQEALARGDLLTACRFWEEARTRHGRTQETDRVAVLLGTECRQRLEQAFGAGWLDQARGLLLAAQALQPLTPALAEYQRLMNWVLAAAEKLAQVDYLGMREALLRLQGARGEATWIQATLRPLDDILRAQSELLSSPLGILGASLYKNTEFGKANAGAAAHNQEEQRPAAKAAPGALVNEKPLLILVDGTGSALLVARDVLRIGRAGGLRDIEIPIPADIQSHHADVIRDGDDYFLAARGPVQVNHRTISRTLLRHGDRIVLGKNAKMIFHKPSSKSETAVLRLASGSRLPQDVSFIVLFKGACLIGPQSACHVQTREGDTRLVMFERAGELFVRRAARDGRPTGPAEALPGGETCEIGDLRLTVTQYKLEGSGESA